MSFSKLSRVLLPSAAVLQTATSAVAAGGAVKPAVEYTLTVLRPHTHVFEVRMEITGTERSELDVSMPVWTPGSYLVREYERGVVRFSAGDGEGRALSWHKVDKNTWRIATDGAGRILVDYDVYAREPGIRWSFLYDEGGHVLGPNLFMYVVGAPDAPASATFDLPAGWRLNGAIAPAGDNPYRVSASSYHELIDAPLLFGNFNAWIHVYRSDESFNNYRTNYYFKGRVIANRTHGAKGVDDLMRLMWQRTRDQGTAFDSEGIRAACEEIAAGSFREFFDRYVYGTEDIPFKDFYRLAGYDLIIDQEAGRLVNRTGYLGVYLGESNGRVRLDGVVRGGPAWRGGLSYGDEIIAVDGREVGDLESLQARLSPQRPGQTVELTVSRFGRQRTITVRLGERSPIYKVVELDEPSEAQLAVRRRWRQGR